MKTVLITGASRGIGAAVARAAAAAGWAVALNYRSGAVPANALANELRAQGASVFVLQGDVSVEADVVRMFKEIDEGPSRLEGLVNNAGILYPAARLEDFDLARWNAVFATNVAGAFLCTREAVRRMSRRHGGNGGSIVNNSSMAALLGGPDACIDYAASKGALDSMTIGLARELAGDGIRVNSVRPGLIETEIHAGSGDPARVERLVSSVPMGRAGTAEEVARAIVWLLSGDSSYTTGATIAVSGGR